MITRSLFFLTQVPHMTYSAVYFKEFITVSWCSSEASCVLVTHKKQDKVYFNFQKKPPFLSSKWVLYLLTLEMARFGLYLQRWNWGNHRDYSLSSLWCLWLNFQSCQGSCVPLTTGCQSLYIQMLVTPSETLLWVYFQYCWLTLPGRWKKRAEERRGSGVFSFQ